MNKESKHIKQVPLGGIEGASMRGIAILAIILHNYCHWLPMVQENEYTYTQGNSDRLWAILQSPGQDILAQLLSFFGHYGVPIFVFLSAYGLVMKYEASQPPGGELSRDASLANESAGKTISKDSPFGGWGAFIWQHYKKLFLMMIVGYAAFVMVDYMTPGHRHYEFWNVIGQLGMFSNLYSNPDHDIWPGPYWYFGLMVQIYIVYRLVFYRGKGSIGGLLSENGNYRLCSVVLIITLTLHFSLDPESLQMQWYRYNVFGSLPVFCLGLLYARSERRNTFPKWEHAVNVLLMTAIIIGFSMNFDTWIFVPFCIVAGTLSLVKCLPEFILKPLAWVGSISAAMFVCHPIVRKVLIPISRGGDLYTGLILYLVATLVLAIFFKHLNAIVSGKK